ncbi:MAG: hypothetical protein RSD47_02740 [Romboutsia sp.]
MLKNFFSFKSKFNIFFIVGLLVILSNFYFTGPPLVLIGLIIAWIPEIYQSIVDYKKSDKINPILISFAIVFIALAAILSFDLLGI